MAAITLDRIPVMTRLRPELYQWLVEEAQANDRSVSTEVARMIQQERLRREAQRQEQLAHSDK